MKSLCSLDFYNLKIYMQILIYVVFSTKFI